MESTKNRVSVLRDGLEIPNAIRRVWGPFLMMALLLVGGGTWANVAQGRSIYVIGQITNYYGDLPVLAYDIGQGGQLTFQTRQGIPFRDGGAVGIAIDWQSEYLFVTYEFSGFLEVLDARTMAVVGKVSATEAENLAGIAYDETKGYLYCVDRGTDKLYSYRWYPSTGKLIPQAGSPFTLEGSSSYGIALDEENGLLYTANGSKTVPVYRTSDWSKVKTLTVSRPAISVAVDPFRNMLYTGAGYLSDSTLNQYNLTTGQTTSVTVDSGAGVMGLAVDLATGCVYTTTGLSNRPGGDDLLVYDASLTLVQSILDIGNPTGIVIPARELGYNPLNFAKEIVLDGVVQNGDEIFVSIGDTITYQLCFENAVTVSDVSIVDSLPEHVTFVDADGDGDSGHYDAQNHTYSWSLDSVSAGSTTCLSLRVKVDARVPVGTVLRNYATIRTRTIPPTTVSVDATVREGIYEPLGLTKQVVGGVQREDGRAYANAGDIVSYRIQYSNEQNTYPVTDVFIVDTLPEAMTFVAVEDNPLGGAYDPVEHTYTCLCPLLAPGETGSITLRAQVKDNVVAGSIITNSATIDCAETGPTTATADVVVAGIELAPLNLTKEILAGGVDPGDGGLRQVEIGEEVIYLICFDNQDNERAVEAVTIVDFLPPQMTFVSADGEGDFGRYEPDSHTYTWSISSLAPGETSCVELVAQVKEDAVPGTVILNRATIDSDQTEATMADISVVVSEIEFRPLGLEKRIAAGAIPGDDKAPQTIGIGDSVTYQICFDSNDNDYRIQGLTLVDTLPPEVTFVSADGEGVYGSYDRERHAYTWSYPSLLPGASACLNLVVQVRDDTSAGTTVTNTVTIDSDDTDPQTARVSAVAQPTQLKPFDLTKTVTSGVTGQDERGTQYVAVGQELTYTVCMTNPNHLAVSNVRVIDTLPADVAFVSADGDGEYGRYDAATHTYTWSYPTFAADAQICVTLTVRVNDEAEHGVTIRNRVRLEAGDTSSTTDNDVVTELEPPLLTKTVLFIDGQRATGQENFTASPGSEVTYEICFENDRDVPLHNVLIVDTLPAGTVFVDADGNSGHYDPASHTYVWSYARVEPGPGDCLRLTVRLGYNLEPGAILRNTATLDASETPPTDSDVDVVVGDAPMKVGLTPSPLILGREGYNRSDQITAVLTFPADIAEGDLGTKPLQLDPGGIKAGSQTVSIKNGVVQIRASFDLFSVLDAIADDGITTLYVGGQFQSGRAFYGEAAVLVVAVRPF